MPESDTFTFQELRITLTAFAIWAALAEPNSEQAVDLVDRFIKETTAEGNHA